MATAEDYPRIVKEIIRHYASFPPSYGEVEVETIFDDALGHYELMYSGWHRRDRVHGCVIHIDIRGERILIQHDGTERGVALDLVDAGFQRNTWCSRSSPWTSGR